jgi:hypothetical protein
VPGHLSAAVNGVHAGQVEEAAQEKERERKDGEMMW